MQLRRALMEMLGHDSKGVQFTSIRDTDNISILSERLSGDIESASKASGSVHKAASGHLAATPLAKCLNQSSTRVVPFSPEDEPRAIEIEPS
mmetsp:Transcript_61309/g.121309  ORF Transcript_61309/g.121309 Transcript_61309/m.121309 type:complete len:92 (+) Transcript_61309:3-278(+)